jgi:ABC-type uncharacterized transport system YnjBCD substrate-binding protein
MVKDPPSTYAELEKWVQQNPKKFGYNGIKGGMSGVRFVVGWIYADTPPKSVDQILTARPVRDDSSPASASAKALTPSPPPTSGAAPLAIAPIK